MTATMPRVLLTTALVLSGWVTPAAAQSNPCGLLTSAEVAKHIVRGRPTFNETPDAHRMSGGVVCVYADGEIALWAPPNAERNFEGYLEFFKADKAKRFPVQGVGDKAWISFPPPADEYQDRVAYVVAYVGQKLVSVGLYARNGAADGLMGKACRAAGGQLTPRQQEDCKKLLADTSETQESLQPAVIELAMLVVAKVRSGKGS